MKKYSLLLLLLLIPYYAFAVIVDEYPTLDFTINNPHGWGGECSVKGRPYNISETLIIPSEVTIEGRTYPVTEIGWNAFNGWSWVTSVEIPSSVTKIETNAFSGCSSLTSVVISWYMLDFGAFVFYGCSSLKELIFKGYMLPRGFWSDCLTGADNCTIYVANKGMVSTYKKNFPEHEMKPLLNINADYVKSGGGIKVTYPNGYSPKRLVYSVIEGNATIAGDVISGHGAVTVKVVDAENTDIYAKTTLNVYVSGDSNDNGTVDITDAVNTSNYIVGKKPGQFLEIAANVVEPDKSEITVADVVATVDIMLAAPATEPSEVSKALYAPANSTDCLTLCDHTEGIALSLAGESVFSALQADVTLPAGTVLNGVHAGDRLTANHSVMYRMVDDRTVRVAVFALSLDSFVPGDAVVILDVEGMGAGEVTACNVIASDADGHGHRLGVGGGMTGVEGVVPSEGAVVRASGDGITVDGVQGMTVEVYGVDGCLIRRITAGNDSITVDVAPGVYAVRVGAAPAVKIAVR